MDTILLKTWIAAYVDATREGRTFSAGVVLDNIKSAIELKCLADSVPMFRDQAC